MTINGTAIASYAGLTGQAAHAAAQLTVSALQRSLHALLLVLMFAVTAPAFAGGEEASLIESSQQVPESLRPRLNAKALRLTIGRQYPVCEAILANLNAQKYPARALGDWPILIKDPLLKKPAWQDVDPRQYKYIMAEVIREQKWILPFLPYSSKEPATTDEEIDTKIEAGIASGDIVMQMAVVRLNHDLRAAQMFRYILTREEPGAQHWRHYARIEGEGGSYRDVAQQGGMKDPADIFVYDGRTYLVNGDEGTFRVSEVVYLRTSDKVGLDEYACWTVPVVQGEKP